MTTLLSALALGGLSAYLPLDLPPSQARQITLLFALADETVMRRPISLSAVDDAMTRACPRDPSLCDDIESWLSRYRSRMAVTTLKAEVALADDTSVPLANRRGLRSDDAWWFAATAAWQPADHLLLSAGATARDGEVVPTGSLLSAGYDFARLDVGFRDRWSSPLADSAWLQSTEAATMASASLSNERPLGRLRLRYELNVSRMSLSRRIVDGDVLTQGHPLLAGLHLAVQPAPGWSLGAARQLQYGGGSRDARLPSLLRAFVAPNHYDNSRTGRPEEFGNQQAAWSSSFIFPGAKPVVVSMEFAGEDTSHGTPGRLGNAGITLGVEIPRLWHDMGLRYEASEWQNGWYTHHLYTDGLVNRGQVTGHWGAAWRASGDDVGGQSHSLSLQWNLRNARSLELQWRTLRNDAYSPIPYRRAMEFAARYSQPLGRLQAGGGVMLGRDVYGDRYYRLSAFARPRQQGDALGSEAAATGPFDASIFVDVGASLTHLRISTDAPGAPSTTIGSRLSPHVAVGLRRAAWSHSDLGVRLELDRDSGYTLMALRALDYRYRLGTSLALTAFLGAARMSGPLAAYGYYAGGGLQWRDARPRWDVNLDLRYGDKLARDELAPDGTLQGNADTFRDVFSAAVYLSRRF